MQIGSLTDVLQEGKFHRSRKVVRKHGSNGHGTLYKMATLPVVGVGGSVGVGAGVALGGIIGAGYGAIKGAQMSYNAGRKHGKLGTAAGIVGAVPAAIGGAGTGFLVGEPAGAVLGGAAGLAATSHLLYGNVDRRDYGNYKQKLRKTMKKHNFI